MKKDRELHSLAVSLCEGDIVKFNGHWIMAKEVPGGDPCYECEMDCICDSDMKDLCAECDAYNRKKNCLYLANERVINLLT